MAQVQSLAPELDTLNHVLRLVDAFRAFDADDDGHINATVLGGIMGSLGYKPTEKDIKNMMQNGDKNTDGMLSIEEFLDLNTKDLEVDFLAPLRRAIQDLDIEGEEPVTGDVLFDVLGNMGLEFSIEECQNIISVMDGDGDGDGAISLEDLRLTVNSL